MDWSGKKSEVTDAADTFLETPICIFGTGCFSQRFPMQAAGSLKRPAVNLWIASVPRYCRSSAEKRVYNSEKDALPGISQIMQEFNDHPEKVIIPNELQKSTGSDKCEDELSARLNF